MPSGDGKPTVLIVEGDDRLNSQIESALLFQGMRSVPAHSGAEALDQLRAENVDAVVINRKLPDMSGIALSHVLRTQFGPDVSIIIVDGEPNVVEQAKAGADEYVKGPLNAESLVNTLEDLMPKTRTPNGKDH